jgi:hypothetical protein
VSQRLVAVRRDDGAALILALIFITCIGLIVGALLSYTSTGLRSELTTKQSTQASADVGGALQTAINDLRNSTYFNDVTSPTPCLDLGNVKTYPSANGGASVAVTCSPDPTTGAAGGLVRVNNSNRPPLAVLTLGTGSEVGLTDAKNYPLKIKGSVYSNSLVRADLAGTACPTDPPPSSGTNCRGVFLSGPNATPNNVDLYAEGTCAGIFVTPDSTRKHCSTSHTALGNDPAISFPAAYEQPTTGITPRALPACSGNPITFEPGYYDDAAGLSTLMSGSSSCKNKTFWFKPGVYYFDFHDQILSGTPDVWTFDDSTSVLVAGEKNGWTTATNAASMPGTCVSPLTSEGATGVQFVFGGDSQLALNKGSAELCGTWYVDRPSLVLYGAKSDVSTTAENASLAPTAVSSTGSPAFAAPTPPNLQSADGSITSATIPKNKSAALDITTFSGLAAAIPAKATLDSLKVRVTHRETGTDGNTTVQIKVTPNRAGATTITKSLTLQPTLTSQNVDLTADLESEVYRYGLPSTPTPFKVSVVVSAGNTATSVAASVDAVTATASWRALVFHQQGGCVVLPNSCAVVSTAATHTEKFYVQGTAYTPSAKLSIELNSPATAQVFRAGLIARAVYLNVRPSNAFNGPLIELPDNSFGPSPLKVYLTAWTCPSGSCASPPSTGNGWVASGRTQVQYNDPNVVPVSGDRGVAVQSWKLDP